MERTTWQVIDPGGDWKAHAAPTELVDLLVADMRERGCTGEIIQRPTAKYGLDRGGMCYADRPVERVALRGLDLGVPSEHVAHFHRRLVELEPRRFGERTYYKLHSHWNCFVLTPGLRRQLIRSLERRLTQAANRADIFYAEKAVNRSAPGQE